MEAAIVLLGVSRLYVYSGKISANELRLDLLIAFVSTQAMAMW